MAVAVIASVPELVPRTVMVSPTAMSLRAPVTTFDTVVDDDVVTSVVPDWVVTVNEEPSMAAMVPEVPIPPWGPPKPPGPPWPGAPWPVAAVAVDEMWELA